MDLNHAIVAYVLLPMLTGIVTLLFHKQRSIQRGIGGFSLFLMICFSLFVLFRLNDGASAYIAGDVDATYMFTSQMGNWPAPFGITIAVDMLSAMMLAVSSVVCFCVFIYCSGHLGRLEGGYFHPLFHFLMLGVHWAFITGDLFNLFVAFEIMLMASYAMFCIGTTQAQMRQAYVYVILNLVGSTIFVALCGLIYGQLGTLNMADITRIGLAGDLPATSIPVIAMLLIVFAGKAATFPLWFWLPDSYHTLPAALVGLFAGLLTKVGAYVLIRVFILMFGSAVTLDEAGQVVNYPISDMLLPVVLIVAGVTMFLGVLGAVSKHTVRSILAIHIISQVGYMVLGVGLGMATGLADNWREVAIAGGIFFIIHNMVVKCCLFLCGGLMQQHAGSDTLEAIGGLLKRAPWLAVMFMIAALSLAGLPPLSGFFGKFALIQAGWEAGVSLGQSQYFWVTGFAIATSLLTLLSMLKIWSYGFWEPAQGWHVSYPNYDPKNAAGLTSVFLLVVVTLSMGLGAQWYFSMSRNAAYFVLHPEPYVAAILGETYLPNGPLKPANLVSEPQIADPVAVHLQDAEAETAEPNASIELAVPITSLAEHDQAVTRNHAGTEVLR